MMAIRAEAKTKQQREDPFDKSRKRAGSRSRTGRPDGLTCSEAEADAILSEGEST